MSEFYQTDFYLIDEKRLFDALISATKEKVPYGKVLLLATESDFFSRGVALYDALLHAGHRVINFVCDNDFSFSVGNICKLFCAPEDVRAVISISDSLDKTARYFAHTNQILHFSIVNNFNYSLLSDALYLDNDGKTETMFCPCERTVFVDSDIPECDVFAFIELKRAELLDYYLTAVYINDDLDRKSLFKAKGLIDLAESALDYGTVKGKNDALNFVACAISGYPDFFKHSFVSAFNALWRCGIPTQKVFASIDFFVSICQNALLGREAQKPDYAKITQKVSSALGDLEISVLKNLYSQNEKLIKGRYNQSILDCVTFAKTHFDKATASYVKRGGKIKQLTAKEKAFLKLSGDTPFGINAMSVRRELNFCAN